MYGLPEGFDGSFFNGRKLELVCFTENQVLLHFDQDVTVIILSSFDYKIDDQMWSVDDPPGEMSSLMRLLGLRIASAVGARDGTLVLEFEDGSQVTCYDTSPSYESYHIQNGPTVIIV
jgi:hypothetical protein